ncbi:RHS repeat domain-containing protein [Desulfovibrio sp. Fe33]|uniref:RHS repeat domain-containing protein n=1 Tax=Desulfovibrio sp. Fe33 TaxID=3020842 RepID=UPI00234C47B5|nr:RHS repeat-associated core domain-containing protein [Desulfovibrio sp. Fe33]
MHVFEMELKRDRDGRIVEKTETVAGTPATWEYIYDGGGRLTEAHLDGRLICQCHYDREGRRSRDYFPATVGPHYRDYRYTLDNRLLRAGNNTYTHDDNGFRSIWAKGATYLLYEYAPDYRLLRMEIEDQNRVYTFDHDENGQRIAKYCNGQLVEAYHWLDFVRLGGFHDGQHAFEFAYRNDERIPFAMRRDDGTVFGLFSDQVGSLRVVVDSNDNMIKEIVYNPFGGIIEDTNPDFRIPIGFAGGLHDRDLGFVRFGWRDYDANTGRWTAPDPIGDKGGDPDWYGYCLDDPVNMSDATGLNPLLAWSQYIPAVNSIGKQIAKDVMTGEPGYSDIPNLIWDGAKAYGEYVKNNAEKMRKDNRQYYDELYGRNNKHNGDQSTPNPPTTSRDEANLPVKDYKTIETLRGR